MFVSKLACPFTITSKKIDQAKCIYCCFVTLIMTLKTVHHFYSSAGASPAVLYKTQINNVPNESLLCLKRALNEEYHSSSHPNHFSMALMYHHRFTAAHCNRSMTKHLVWGLHKEPDHEQRKQSPYLLFYSSHITSSPKKEGPIISKMHPQ